MVPFTVAAPPVLREYAPPAMVFLQALHFQMPATTRFTVSCAGGAHAQRGPARGGDGGPAGVGPSHACGGESSSRRGSEESRGKACRGRVYPAVLFSSEFLHVLRCTGHPLSFGSFHMNVMGLFPPDGRVTRSPVCGGGGACRGIARGARTRLAVVRWARFEDLDI